MLHAKAFAKNPAGSCLCVVEKIMLPHCILQECFACVAHVVEKAVRDARVAESQAERVAQARVRAARHTDLPFLLAGAAEQGAIAARGTPWLITTTFLIR